MYHSSEKIIPQNLGSSIKEKNNASFKLLIGNSVLF